MKEDFADHVDGKTRWDKMNRGTVSELSLTLVGSCGDFTHDHG